MRLRFLPAGALLMRVAAPRDATHPGQQRGMAVVELALVLPIFLLVVFMIAEFGIIFYNKAVITNASREGARLGIVLRATKPSDNEIQSKAVDYMSNYLFSFGADNSTRPPAGCSGTTCRCPTNTTASPNPCVNVTGGQGTFGNPLTVTVRYTYRPLGINPLIDPNTLPIIGSPLTLTTTTVMNHE